MKLKYILMTLSMALVGWVVLKAPAFLKKKDAAVITTMKNVDARYQTFEQRITNTKKIEDLVAINQELGSIKGHEFLYLQAYNLYWQAIQNSKTKNNENAKAAIEKAIALLDNSSEKSSEDYALLSLARAFSIQFATFFDVASIAGKAKEDYEKAMVIDSTNLRAYLVAGINDMHTPAMFGGGKKTVYFLEKAIALNTAPNNNGHSVGWGKDQAYISLISFYKAQGKKQEAENLRLEALKVFPENEFLKTI
jgi:tetratricopeptide (TPR) repeat protein